jgi:hypothetical protein
MSICNTINKNHSPSAFGFAIASRDPALALAESESEKREVRSPGKTMAA